jgi:hypothetical protein
LSERPTGAIGQWTADAIDRRDRDLLASFADRVVLDVDGLGATLFCHGTPLDDEELLTALAPGSRASPRTWWSAVTRTRSSTANSDPGAS